MAIPPPPPDTHAVALADGWVLYRPATGRLAVLNGTGKLVWDLASAGDAPDAIAAVFARQFGLTDEQALADVGAALTHLEDAGFLPFAAGGAGAARGDPLPEPAPIEAAAQTAKVTDCGTFHFGARLITVHATVPGIDAAYFLRFAHRRATPDVGADESVDILDIVGKGRGYRLALRGETLAEERVLTDLLGRVHELFLSWEYPDTDVLAYFHAAAVRRDGRTILLPGRSGVGKSTLTAWLVAQGFGYLGDDLIGMRDTDGALLPSPTLLSLKSGAWPILEPLYPALPRQPTAQCRDRIVRYIVPDRTHTDGAAAPAPSVIVFPRYDKDRPLRLERLAPLLTMARLIDSGLALHQPMTHATLATFIRFVEQTPAYALTYSDIHGATAAIDALLSNPS